VTVPQAPARHRCHDEQLQDPGYFEEVVQTGFGDPSPWHLHVEGGLSPHERALLQAAVLPRGIGSSALAGIHSAEVLTGALSRVL